MSMTLRMSRLLRVLPVALLTLVMTSSAFAATPRRPEVPRAPSPTTATPDVHAEVAKFAALVQQRTDNLSSLAGQRVGVARQLAQVRKVELLLGTQEDSLAERAATAKQRYETARKAVARMAVASYTAGAGTSDLMSVLDSKDVLELSRRTALLDEIASMQQQRIAQARKDRSLAEQAAKAAQHEVKQLHDTDDNLSNTLADLDGQMTNVRASLDRATNWYAKWDSIVAGTATPILGQEVLTGADLATWFAANRRDAHITVPMSELANDYIQEGAAAGVRGDIAFAQSLLETASFRFPAGGQLTPDDNNFAGIGACDSCATGRSYPSADIGVRAQVQLLRVYADRNLTNAELHPPAVDPRLDTHFLKGKVTTWGGLTHTWATANGYGDRILQIYTQILAWLTDQANI
jgi:hypothetical protein